MLNPQRTLVHRVYPKTFADQHAHEECDGPQLRAQAGTTDVQIVSEDRLEKDHRHRGGYPGGVAEVGGEGQEEGEVVHQFYHRRTCSAALLHLFQLVLGRHGADHGDSGQRRPHGRLLVLHRQGQSLLTQKLGEPHPPKEEEQVSEQTRH